MSRGTDKAFDLLHGIMAEGMAEELARNLEAARKPRLIPDPDDPKKKIVNPEWMPLDTRLANVARAFLKDNGVDAPATSPRLNGLADQLRDLDLDEVANQRVN